MTALDCAPDAFTLPNDFDHASVKALAERIAGSARWKHLGLLGASLIVDDMKHAGYPAVDSVNVWDGWAWVTARVGAWVITGKYGRGGIRYTLTFTPAFASALDGSKMCDWPKYFQNADTPLKTIVNIEKPRRAGRLNKDVQQMVEAIETMLRARESAFGPRQIVLIRGAIDRLRSGEPPGFCSPSPWASTH